MNRPYATDEQYERWYMIDCCRCGRHRNKAGAWPDGHVCRTCYDQALRVRGCCLGCGEDRVLPGLREDGAAICIDCAGFTTSFRCSRCPEEGKLHGGRLCTRCTLSGRLAELLDDGTGRIRPDLVPLHTMLTTTDNPLSGLSWLYRRRGETGPADLLRGLGSGSIPLTHEAFHQVEPWRAAAHLRELLMACELLPPRDKQICLFERWLTQHLAGVADPDHAQIVRRFATWRILATLRASAEHEPLTPASRKTAGERVTRATAFLGWLADRGLGLADCRQAEVDAWHAEHRQHDHLAARPFLLWCADTRLTRRFTLPSTQARRAAPLTHTRRIALLHQILTDAAAPLRSRVAAGLVLLYAQPVSRIVRLTLDDIVRDDDQILIRLGDPPTPVPAPFAAILLDYTTRRSNMRTATNPSSTWLFPGRRAGQPLHPEHLSALIHELGVPTVASRTAAFRRHVTEMPAPVVADALGYHQVTAAKAATQAGTAWSRYAPGDHTPSTPRRTRDS